MDEVIADLKVARQAANEAALHIGHMIFSLENSTTIYTERSHAAQKLDRALTIIRRSYDAGVA